MRIRGAGWKKSGFENRRTAGVQYKKDNHAAQCTNEPAKSERFDVRDTAQQAHMIKAGAARRNVNLTEYILDSTCAQAAMDLADQNHFPLPEKQWKAFLKALDAPPKIPVGLKRLFARRSVAESR